jgi:hypothetical protein
MVNDSASLHRLISFTLIFSILYQLFFREKNKQAQFMYRKILQQLSNFYMERKISFFLQGHGAVVPQLINKLAFSVVYFSLVQR